MQFLARKAFKYKIFTVMIMVLVVCGAWFCVKNMKSSLLPEILLPRVSAVVVYRSNKEDNSALIADPLEKAFLAIDGVRNVRTEVTDGYVRFKVSFREHVSLEESLKQVNLAVDAKMSGLPTDCPRPVTQLDSGNYPTECMFRISGLASPNALYRAGRELQKNIESIPGVYAADMWGHRVEQVCIELDLLKLANIKMSVSDVLRKILVENVSFYDVDLSTDTGPVVLHTRGGLLTPDEIAELPVAADKGHVLKIKDIAVVYTRAKRTRMQNRYQGKDSLMLVVQKGHNVDTFSLMKRIGWAVSAFNDEQRCYDMQCETIWDSAPIIKSRIWSLYNTLLCAIILVVLLVSLSLGLRSTFLVGLTIPVTFMVALGVLHLMGLTLNMILLFGLIGAVGVLVDGAIIVNEYADDCLRRGALPKEAYEEAAKRMVWPAFTSVLTIVLSFTPLLFWPGTVGMYMRHLPITFVVTLSVSIVCALIFMPVLGATLPTFGRKKIRKELWTFRGVMRWYEKYLKLTLSYPKIVGSGILMLGVAVCVWFSVKHPGYEFFPNIEPNYGKVKVVVPEALSDAQGEKITDEVEKVVRAHKHIEHVWSFVGAESDHQKCVASVHFTFVHWKERPPVKTILKKLKESFANTKGYTVTVGGESETPVGRAIEISVGSASPEKARAFANKMTCYLRSREESDVVSVNTPPANFSWNLKLKRDVMAQCDVPAAVLRDNLALLGTGVFVRRYVPDQTDFTVDVWLTAPKRFQNWNYIYNMPVKLANGQFSSLGTFFDVEPQESMAFLLRYKGMYNYDVTWNLKEGFFLEKVLPEVKAWTKKNKPSGVQIDYVGSVEERDLNVHFMIMAFLCSLLLIAMILLIQFNNLFQVSVVLSSVVFSTIGGLLGLLLSGHSFGLVMNGIGFVALNGIIVSNNVILLDTYNALIAEGKEHFKALISASVSRIRPIFLTQITTVLGLVPMMFGVEIQPLSWALDVGSPESAWWVHISTTIVSGVLFATPFTLFATPLLLHTRHWFKMRSNNRLGS